VVTSGLPGAGGFPGPGAGSSRLSLNLMTVCIPTLSTAPPSMTRGEYRHRLKALMEGSSNIGALDSTTEMSFVVPSAVIVNSRTT
jgi:hypothetical protein